MQFEADPLLREDLLQNAAVLRLLLTGGLFTQSINSRHRKQGPTDCTCSVGGEQTVEHVSWYCAHHHDIRQPILHLFHLIIQASPAFRFASIVTSNDANLRPHIQLIQIVLIKIWRNHIKKYLEGTHSDPKPDDHPIRPTTNNSQPTSSSQSPGLEENGHHIISLGTGGVLCQKCGKFTSEPKHRRLKISSKKCQQAHLAPEFWTTIPSKKDNPNTHLDHF